MYCPLTAIELLLVCGFIYLDIDTLEILLLINLVFLQFGSPPATKFSLSIFFDTGDSVKVYLCLAPLTKI